MLPLDRLIVVAGPSCCGKSFFIRRFRSGEYPDIASALDADNITNWVYQDSFYLNAKALQTIEQSPAREMVLHWTIPTPTIRFFLRNLVLLFAYDKKERLRLLRSANHLTILIPYTSQTNFLTRVQARRLRIKGLRQNGVDSVIKYHRKMGHLRRMEKFYSESANLVHLYNRWFHMCKSLNANSMYLVNLENEPSLVSVEKWPEIAEQWSKERMTSPLPGS